MIAVPRTVSATVTSGIMDDTLDSSQLATLHSVSLDTTGTSSLVDHDQNSALERTVDSSALSDTIGAVIIIGVNGNGQRL